MRATPYPERVLVQARLRHELRNCLSRAQALARQPQPQTGADAVRAEYPPSPTTPALARNLVFDACMAWGLPDLAYRVRQVMSELATNAVEHAGTRLDVWAVRQDEVVFVAVSDGLVTAPSIDGNIGAELCSGRSPHGLSIVGRLASHWGCISSKD